MPGCVMDSYSCRTIHQIAQYSFLDDAFYKFTYLLTYLQMQERQYSQSDPINSLTASQHDEASVTIADRITP